MSGRPSGPRVGVFGYFGMGNIGNEGSLAAVLAGLGSRRPDLTVRGLVAVPEQVRADHGIDAVPMMWHRGDPAAPVVPETVRKVVGRIVDVPRTWWLVRDVDALVVPGTGVLETQLMARPWGMPYWLFLATLACRARGRPVALVGVGAEPAQHPLTRLLFAGTARLATWTSVRDEPSRDVLRSWGVARPVPVVPDVAFALPVPDGGPARQGHVVVGVMGYEGDPADPTRGQRVVRDYRRRMAEMVGRLLATGCSVSLVVGDVADLPLAREIRDTVVQDGPGAGDRVSVSSARTLEALMTEMAAAEVAVVSRFHNLVSALVVGTPAVSLSYADKSARLLTEFGLEGLVQPIEGFDVDLLLAQVDRARSARPTLEVTVKEVAGRYAEELKEHLDQLCDEVLEGPPGGRDERSRRARRPRGGLPPRRR
jgi:polysaccharide pyruvyl transferase WcaK-like protein